MKVWLPFCLVFSCVPLALAEPQAQVRTTIVTKGDIWVGQKVVLAVELLAPGFFAGAAVFDLPRVPDTLLIPPQGSPVMGSEQIDGTSYTVQRHELSVFGYRSGKIEVPPFKIRFPIKRNALDHDAIDQGVQTTAVSFEAKQPPGTSPGEILVTSADLQVQESWKPEPGKAAKTGDAFVRKLVWTSSDVPGMAFPPFKSAAIAGLGIYPAEPLVTDKAERGELHGQRTDSVTYVCKTGGVITIPAYTVRWWDSVKKEMQRVEFPSRTIDVTAPPVPPVPLGTRMEIFFRRHASSLLAGTIALVALGYFVRFTWPWWKRLFHRLLPRHLAVFNPPGNP